MDVGGGRVGVVVGEAQAQERKSNEAHMIPTYVRGVVLMLCSLLCGGQFSRPHFST